MNDAIAVVLGMGPTALSLVRSLGRRGVKVYGIGLSRWEVALRSRYCTPLGAIDPRQEPERLLECLLQFARNQSSRRRLLLYPTGDECVVFVGEHHAELASSYSFSRLDPETIELFLNKERFHRACREHGMPTPLTLAPTSLDELRDWVAKGPFPCILKPKYYHRWAVQHGLAKVIYCQSAGELLGHAHLLGPRITDFIVQEVVTGPEENIYVFAAYFDQGSQPHGVFVGQKVRQYPVGFGTTTMMRTAKAPDIERRSVSFLKGLGYQGLCDVEYKYDSSMRIFKIIEINPRIGRWYGLVEAAGCETVYYSYLDLAGSPIPNTSGGRARSVTWAFVPRDVLAVLTDKRGSCLRAIESYRRPMTWCIWSRDDPKPFFAYFAEMASKGWRALVARKRRRSAVATRTSPEPVAERGTTP